MLLELYQLPETLKLEVFHYIMFLKKEYRNQEKLVVKKKRKAGSAKGKYVIKSDFDAPIDDFKDYM
ncbi:MAG: DUF2281 domain-containing protein [Leptospiraceae bacterium]|nr:DUF2281 domain-containing protein [Leptospiraceae bacterium]